jgi:hypothetical protein
MGENCNYEVVERASNEETEEYEENKNERE